LKAVADQEEYHAEINSPSPYGSLATTITQYEADVDRRILTGTGMSVTPDGFATSHDTPLKSFGMSSGSPQGRTGDDHITGKREQGFAEPASRHEQRALADYRVIDDITPDVNTFDAEEVEASQNSGKESLYPRAQLQQIKADESAYVAKLKARRTESLKKQALRMHSLADMLHRKMLPEGQPGQPRHSEKVRQGLMFTDSIFTDDNSTLATFDDQILCPIGVYRLDTPRVYPDILLYDISPTQSQESDGDSGTPEDERPPGNSPQLIARLRISVYRDGQTTVLRVTDASSASQAKPITADSYIAARDNASELSQGEVILPVTAVPQSVKSGHYIIDQHDRHESHRHSRPVLVSMPPAALCGMLNTTAARLSFLDTMPPSTASGIARRARPPMDIVAEAFSMNALLGSLSQAQLEMLEKNARKIGLWQEFEDEPGQHGAVTDSTLRSELTKARQRALQRVHKERARIYNLARYLLRPCLTLDINLAGISISCIASSRKPASQLLVSVPVAAAAAASAAARTAIPLASGYATQINRAISAAPLILAAQEMNVGHANQSMPVEDTILSHPAYDTSVDNAQAMKQKYQQNLLMTLMKLLQPVSVGMDSSNMTSTTAELNTSMDRINTALGIDQDSLSNSPSSAHGFGLSMPSSGMQEDLSQSQVPIHEALNNIARSAQSTAQKASTAALKAAFEAYLYAASMTGASHLNLEARDVTGRFDSTAAAAALAALSATTRSGDLQRAASSLMEGVNVTEASVRASAAASAGTLKLVETSKTIGYHTLDSGLLAPISILLPDSAETNQAGSASNNENLRSDRGPQPTPGSQPDMASVSLQSIVAATAAAAVIATVGAQAGVLPASLHQSNTHAFASQVVSHAKAHALAMQPHASSSISASSTSASVSQSQVTGHVQVSHRPVADIAGARSNALAADGVRVSKERYELLNIHVANVNLWVQNFRHKQEVELVVGAVQVDNQLPESRDPVILSANPLYFESASDRRRRKLNRKKVSEEILNLKEAEVEDAESELPPLRRGGWAPSYLPYLTCTATIAEQSRILRRLKLRRGVAALLSRCTPATRRLFLESQPHTIFFRISRNTVLSQPGFDFINQCTVDVAPLKLVLEEQCLYHVLDFVTTVDRALSSLRVDPGKLTRAAPSRRAIQSYSDAPATIVDAAALLRGWDEPQRRVSVVEKQASHLISDALRLGLMEEDIRSIAMRIQHTRVPVLAGDNEPLLAGQHSNIRLGLAVLSQCADAYISAKETTASQATPASDALTAIAQYLRSELPSLYACTLYPQPPQGPSYTQTCLAALRILSANPTLLLEELTRCRPKAQHSLAPQAQMYIINLELSRLSIETSFSTGATNSSSPEANAEDKTTLEPNLGQRRERPSRGPLSDLDEDAEMLQEMSAAAEEGASPDRQSSGMGYRLDLADDTAVLGSNGSSTTGAVDAILKGARAALLNIDNAPLAFNSIKITSTLTTPAGLTNKLTNHFTAQAMMNVHLLLGATDIFGNPVQFMKAIRRGMADLGEEVATGVRETPAALVSGIFRGTISLIRHSTFGMLYSLSRVLLSVSKGATTLSTALDIPGVYDDAFVGGILGDDASLIMQQPALPSRASTDKSQTQERASASAAPGNQPGVSAHPMLASVDSLHTASGPLSSPTAASMRNAPLATTRSSYPVTATSHTEAAHKQALAKETTIRLRALLLSTLAARAAAFGWATEDQLWQAIQALRLSRPRNKTWYSDAIERYLGAIQLLFMGASSPSFEKPRKKSSKSLVNTDLVVTSVGSGADIGELAFVVPMEGRGHGDVTTSTGNWKNHIGVFSGLRAGLYTLMRGPYVGFSRDGLKGGVTAAAKGVGSAIVLPMLGGLNAAYGLAETLQESVSPYHRSVRVRSPRLFGLGCILSPRATYPAFLTQVVSSHLKLHPHQKFLTYAVSLPENSVLLKSDNILNQSPSALDGLRGLVPAGCDLTAYYNLQVFAQALPGYLRDRQLTARTQLEAQSRTLFIFTTTRMLVFRIVLVVPKEIIVSSSSSSSAIGDASSQPYARADQQIVHGQPTSRTARSGSIPATAMATASGPEVALSNAAGTAVVMNNRGAEACEATGMTPLEHSTTTGYLPSSAQRDLSVIQAMNPRALIAERRLETAALVDAAQRRREFEAITKSYGAGGLGGFGATLHNAILVRLQLRNDIPLDLVVPGSVCVESAPSNSQEYPINSATVTDKLSSTAASPNTGLQYAYAQHALGSQQQYFHAVQAAPTATMSVTASANLLRPPQTGKLNQPNPIIPGQPVGSPGPSVPGRLSATTTPTAGGQPLAESPLASAPLTTQPTVTGTGAVVATANDVLDAAPGALGMTAVAAMQPVPTPALHTASRPPEEAQTVNPHPNPNPNPNPSPSPNPNPSGNVPGPNANPSSTPTNAAAGGSVPPAVYEFPASFLDADGSIGPLGAMGTIAGPAGSSHAQSTGVSDSGVGLHEGGQSAVQATRANLLRMSVNVPSMNYAPIEHSIPARLPVSVLVEIGQYLELLSRRKR